MDVAFTLMAGIVPAIVSGLAPFLRLLDVYIGELDTEKVDRIRAELDGLVGS